MKDKIVEGIVTALVIIVIVLGVLWYPWFVKVEDGKTTCHNVFGFTMNCR